ncbi:hypothetical protein AB1N83_012077 [Pleurotus pulmonarius]
MTGTNQSERKARNCDIRWDGARANEGSIISEELPKYCGRIIVIYRLVDNVEHVKGSRTRDVSGLPGCHSLQFASAIMA